MSKAPSFTTLCSAICFSSHIFCFFSKNVVLSGTKLLPLDKEGPLNLFEINEETRMVREPLEHRMNFLHSLNLRGVNTVQK